MTAGHAARQVATARRYERNGPAHLYVLSNIDPRNHGGCREFIHFIHFRDQKEMEVFNFFGARDCNNQL